MACFLAVLVPHVFMLASCIVLLLLAGLDSLIVPKWDVLRLDHSASAAGHYWRKAFAFQYLPVVHGCHGSRWVPRAIVLARI
jgi:hypothetical protein